MRQTHIFLLLYILGGFALGSVCGEIMHSTTKKENPHSKSKYKDHYYNHDHEKGIYYGPSTKYIRRKKGLKARRGRNLEESAEGGSSSQTRFVKGKAAGAVMWVAKPVIATTLGPLVKPLIPVVAVGAGAAAVLAIGVGAVAVTAALASQNASPNQIPTYYGGYYTNFPNARRSSVGMPKVAPTDTDYNSDYSYINYPSVTPTLLNGNANSNTTQTLAPAPAPAPSPHNVTSPTNNNFSSLTNTIKNIIGTDKVGEEGSSSDEMHQALKNTTLDRIKMKHVRNRNRKRTTENE